MNTSIGYKMFRLQRSEQQHSIQEKYLYVRVATFTNKLFLLHTLLTLTKQKREREVFDGFDQFYFSRIKISAQIYYLSLLSHASTRHEILQTIV